MPEARVVEACDLSLLGTPMDIQGILWTIREKREALERMTSKLEVLNPHQAFFLMKNVFAIPKLYYVLRITCLLVWRRVAYLRQGTFWFSRESGERFVRMGRVWTGRVPREFWRSWLKESNLLLLSDMSSFLGSMNSVCELMETIRSRTNIADTNKLAGAPLPDDLRCQKAWVLPVVKRNWDNMLLEADQVSRARLMATALKESWTWLNAFSLLGTQLDSESFRVTVALRVGTDVCILGTAAGGWTVCGANQFKFRKNARQCFLSAVWIRLCRSIEYRALPFCMMHSLWI